MMNKEKELMNRIAQGVEDKLVEDWEQDLKWQKEQDEQIRLDFEVYLDDLDYINTDEIVERYAWELEIQRKNINQKLLKIFSNFIVKGACVSTNLICGR